MEEESDHPACAVDLVKYRENVFRKFCKEDEIKLYISLQNLS